MLPEYFVLASLILLPPNLASSSQTPNQCLLRCKDNHMREQDNEWSLDFTLPIIELLKATGNETAAYIKAKEICESNGLLDACLDACNASTEIEIIRIGLHAWDKTCDELNNMREVFPCWRREGHRITDACVGHTSRLRNSMEFFARNVSMHALPRVCGNFDEFSNCFISAYARFCGKESGKMTERMFDANKAAIFKMVRLRFRKSPLPDACSSTIMRRDLDFQSSSSSLRGALSLLACVWVLRWL